jgi:hypothetical protein
MPAEDKVALSFPFPSLNPKLILPSSVVARNNDIFKELVLEAKCEYEKDAEHRVHIFMEDM